MFIKKKYISLDNNCDYCEETNEKNKTCNNCSNKICVNCYKKNILCIKCDEAKYNALHSIGIQRRTYNEWIEKLQKIKIELEKKQQYSEEGQILEYNLLI